MSMIPFARSRTSMASRQRPYWITGASLVLSGLCAGGIGAWLLKHPINQDYPELRWVLALTVGPFVGSLVFELTRIVIRVCLDAYGTATTLKRESSQALDFSQLFGSSTSIMDIFAGAKNELNHVPRPRLRLGAMFKVAREGVMMAFVSVFSRRERE